MRWLNERSLLFVFVLSGIVLAEEPVDVHDGVILPKHLSIAEIKKIDEFVMRLGDSKSEAWGAREHTDYLLRRIEEKVARVLESGDLSNAEKEEQLIDFIERLSGYCPSERVTKALIQNIGIVSYPPGRSVTRAVSSSSLLISKREIHPEEMRPAVRALLLRKTEHVSKAVLEFVRDGQINRLGDEDRNILARLWRHVHDRGTGPVKQLQDAKSAVDKDDKDYAGKIKRLDEFIPLVEKNTVSPGDGLLFLEMIK